MFNFAKRNVDQKVAFGFIVVLAAAVLFLFGICDKNVGIDIPGIFRIPKKPDALKSAGEEEIKDVKKFLSEEDFKKYLAEAELLSYGSVGFGRGGGEIMALEAPPMKAETQAAPITPDRISETNVQVIGVDEPDIVKTDGKEIYFSPGYIYRTFNTGGGIAPMMEGFKMTPPYYQQPGIKTIKVFPPADLKIDAEIKDTGGDLLLIKNILVVFNGQEIKGFNVANPKAPTKEWEIKLESNTSLVGARLYSGKIYIIVRQNIYESRPCPIKPLSLNGADFEIKCVDVYHPVYPVPSDVTFTATVLDPQDGKIGKSISFIGSSGSSVLYMSSNAIYFTYSYSGDISKFIFNFFKEKGDGISPVGFADKLEKLSSYDIGQAAKMAEYETLWSKYIQSLSDDERLRIQNEFSNRMSDYYKNHKRELEKTGIVKVKVGDLELEAAGNIPGQPLNQFSLDEYQNYLRIASTVGGRWFGFNISNGESANDIYVLDKNLKISGAVYDLGLTEKIYSVRFVEDKGYVVTFRQVDPFYVLDLSEPQNPKLKGELKIPGYSSYLHPLAENIILGVGQEDWKVKLSIFDVSFAEKPLEKSKYILDEGWTEVNSNPRAFLQDTKHKVFFLPGGQGGYIFSYADNNLKLVKAISGISAKRALYINDYLYIIESDKIVVFNELDWQKVNELDLTK